MSKTNPYKYHVSVRSKELIADSVFKSNSDINEYTSKLNKQNLTELKIKINELEKLKIGDRVYVDGEGNEVFGIINIKNTQYALSSGWLEPMYKCHKVLEDDFEELNNKTNLVEIYDAREEFIINATEDILIYMEDHDISKSNLAMKLGKTKHYIDELFNDERNMTLNMISDICFLIGIKPKLVFFENNHI